MNKYISISLPKSLLEQIEKNVKGENRSEKVRKCIQKGYKLLRENGD